jgi:membrane protein
VAVLLGALALVAARVLAFASLEFRVPYPHVLGTLAELVVLTLGFVPPYYLLAPVDTTVRQVLPGAALAAVGWVLLQTAVCGYPLGADRYAGFGLLGAVVLFVTAFCLAATVLVLGGAVNEATDW